MFNRGVVVDYPFSSFDLLFLLSLFLEILEGYFPFNVDNFRAGTASYPFPKDEKMTKLV